MDKTKKIQELETKNIQQTTMQPSELPQYLKKHGGTFTGSLTQDPKTKKISATLPDSSTIPETTIKPQDPETIKYLSNVVDGKTGKVSQPFVIGDKKYQMVRGITPNRELVIGVYCFDDLNEAGDNIIHPVDYFEENIAKPMKEAMTAPMGQDIQPLPEKKPIHTLSEFKHFIVNNKSGKVRKFKTIEELAKANMTEEESYMNLPQFRKHVSEKLFGSKQKGLKEVSPTGEENDEEMAQKAKRLMDVIKSNSKIQTIIPTIKTPVAKREVIAAFAEMIGVRRTDLPKLIANLKDIATTNQQQKQQQQPIAENVIKVIKVIKVKDIK